MPVRSELCPGTTGSRLSIRSSHLSCLHPGNYSNGSVRKVSPGFVQGNSPVSCRGFTCIQREVPQSSARLKAKKHLKCIWVCRTSLCELYKQRYKSTRPNWIQPSCEFHTLLRVSAQTSDSQAANNTAAFTLQHQCHQRLECCPEQQKRKQRKLV